MSRVFEISTTGDSLTLDSGRRGKQSFAVTNITDHALRGRIRVDGLPSDKQGWVKVVGDSERDFVKGFTHAVDVAIEVPPTAAPGKFNFKLSAYSVAAPEEDFKIGSDFEVVIPAALVVGKTPMPWWVWLAIALVVVAIGGVIGYVVHKRGGTTTQAPQPASVSGTTPPPPPPAPPVPPPPAPANREFNDPRVAVQGKGNLPLDVCEQYGTNCGKAAADAFCRANGMQGSVDFRIAQDSPPTAIISTKQVCTEATCDRITWVLCSPAPTLHLIANPIRTQMLQALPAKGKQLSTQ